MSARRIRPLQGQVLVRLLPEENVSESGLLLPDKRRRHDGIGRHEPRRAKVLACGVWPTTKKLGRMYSYDFKTGDTVFVDPGMGKNVGAELERLKIYDHAEILAKEE